MSTGFTRTIASNTPAKGLRWLQDEARFWRICAAILGCFAVLKGLRMPSGWALTQSQLDYSHGLVKRGLLGWVYSLLHLHHRDPLSVVFFAELAGFFVLLVSLTRQCRLLERFGTAAVAAAFASSYAVTYLTHLVGYIDIPNAILAMGLLAVRNAKQRFFVGLLVVPVAMLIHESFLLLFLPPVLFSFVLDALTASDRQERRSALVYSAALGGLALLLAFALSLRANLPAPVLKAFQDEISGRIDFPLRDDVFLTLQRSLLANMHDVLVVMKQQQWWRNFFASSLALLPLVLLALRWMHRLISAIAQAHGPRTRRTLYVAAMLSSFSPLLIYAIGWDCARWNVLSVLAAYLTLLLLSRKLPGVVVGLDAMDRNAIVLILAINMATGYGFFDNFDAHPYPFFPALMQHAR